MSLEEAMDILFQHDQRVHTGPLPSFNIAIQ